MKKLNRLALTASMLSVLLCVSGCDLHTNNYEIEGYKKMCEKAGGVQLINNLLTRARCNNGEIVFWKEY